MRRIAILDAPSNLGLRPPTPTSTPGCAKAPGALRDQGLLDRLGARDAGCLTPPRYDPGDWRPGDGVCHADAIAAYSVALAGRIDAIIDAGEFPLVLGGDCSILLGSALAMHRLGEAVGGHIGLVFVDGHSDFRHPGNASYVGAAAGEDLALATGRGQADLAAIEGRRPYFRDVDVVVMGIRAQDEYRLDLQAAGILTRPVPTLRAEGAARSAQWARDQLSDCAGYWVHVDVDVLDPAVMPAVDAPDPGGIAFAELELLIAGLVDTPHCLGVELTVFDPDYDPDGGYAAEITAAVVAGLAPVRAAGAPARPPSPLAFKPRRRPADPRPSAAASAQEEADAVASHGAAWAPRPSAAASTPAPRPLRADTDAVTTSTPGPDSTIADAAPSTRTAAPTSPSPSGQAATTADLTAPATTSRDVRGSAASGRDGSATSRDVRGSAVTGLAGDGSAAPPRDRDARGLSATPPAGDTAPSSGSGVDGFAAAVRDVSGLASSGSGGDGFAATVRDVSGAAAAGREVDASALAVPGGDRFAAKAPAVDGLADVAADAPGAVVITPDADGSVETRSGAGGSGADAVAVSAKDAAAAPNEGGLAAASSSDDGEPAGSAPPGATTAERSAAKKPERKGAKPPSAGRPRRPALEAVDNENKRPRRSAADILAAPLGEGGGPGRLRRSTDVPSEVDDIAKPGRLRRSAADVLTQPTTGGDIRPGKLRRATPPPDDTDPA